MNQIGFSHGKNVTLLDCLVPLASNRPPPLFILRRQVDRDLYTSSRTFNGDPELVSEDSKDDESYSPR